VHRRAAWTLLATAILLAVPASLVVWWVWGQAACGEETYDTPPGSFGDTLCRHLLAPVLPSALLAALPLYTAVVVGILGIRTESRRLLVVAVTAPLVMAFVAVATALAVF
jgi:hypothetical protein